MRFFREITRRIKRFHQDEKGNATVEFVILFPLYMWVFISSIEAGLLMTRNAMLERGVDLVRREMRLNAAWQPTEAQLKREICNVGGMFSNCEENLRIEMTRIDPQNPIYPDATAPCVDRGEPGTTTSIISSNIQNELMLLRVCALVDPIIPNYRFSRFFHQQTEDSQTRLSMMGLGSMVPLQKGGGIALVVSTMYVVEPL
ncbi:MAG: hypothetical protein AAGK92_08760 [Pseudomonadota bacterium]